MRRTAISMTVGLLTVAAVGAVPAAAGTAAPRAAVVAERRAGERLVDLTVASPALGGDATVRLLTPDGWERRGEHDRWPVLYLLHGMFGSHADWVTQSDVERLPALRNVLVVMPDGGDPGGYYTDWWNGGRFGAPAWETFHLDEVRALLERDYGAGARRVVAGASMGGYGALVYAGRHPGMFRAAASYSGPVHLLHPDSVARWQGAFAHPDGAHYLDLWGDPVAQRANWERHDPYRLAGVLRRTPVYLSCGDGEPGRLDGPDPDDQDRDIEAFDRVLNESLAGELHRHRVPVVTHFYRGTHQSAYWERELHRSLPMLLAALH